MWWVRIAAYARDVCTGCERVMRAGDVSAFTLGIHQVRSKAPSRGAADHRCCEYAYSCPRPPRRVTIQIVRTPGITGRSESQQHVLSTFARTVVPLLGRLTVTTAGTARTIAPGSIVAPNHTALADPGLVLAALHRLGVEPVVLATAGLWKIPVLGRRLTREGHIPVHRGSGSAAAALDLAAEALAAGRVVVIYPEGGLPAAVTPPTADPAPSAPVWPASRSPPARPSSRSGTREPAGSSPAGGPSRSPVSSPRRCAARTSTSTSANPSTSPATSTRQPCRPVRQLRPPGSRRSVNCPHPAGCRTLRCEADGSGHSVSRVVVPPSAPARKSSELPIYGGDLVRFRCPWSIPSAR